MGHRNSAARFKEGRLQKKKPVSKDTGESGSGTERCFSGQIFGARCQPDQLNLYQGGPSILVQEPGTAEDRWSQSRSVTGS
jgi:hypothetical protein